MGRLHWDDDTPMIRVEVRIGLHEVENIHIILISALALLVTLALALALAHLSNPMIVPTVRVRVRVGVDDQGWGRWPCLGPPLPPRDAAGSPDDSVGQARGYVPQGFVGAQSRATLTPTPGP